MIYACLKIPYKECITDTSPHSSSARFLCLWQQCWKVSTVEVADGWIPDSKPRGSVALLSIYSPSFLMFEHFLHCIYCKYPFLFLHLICAAAQISLSLQLSKETFASFWGTTIDFAARLIREQRFKSCGIRFNINSCRQQPCTLLIK